MAKVSMYRHTKAEVARPDLQFMNVAASGAIWDCSNFIACNKNYVAIPWRTPGGIVVLNHNQSRKIPVSPPMLQGHSGQVIDLAFSPFDPSLLFSSSEDATIKGWRIGENGVEPNQEAALTLTGHHKKCGILTFHPSANVLASAGSDNIVFMWDAETGRSPLHYSTSEQPTSLSFNIDGSMACVSSKNNRRLTIYDSHNGKVVASAVAHEGSKTQRSVWAKRRNLIVSVGFNGHQHRQLMIWDSRKLDAAVAQLEIDQQSAVMMPLYDEDTNLLYLAGKGDGTISFYELWNEPVPVVYCSAYSSTDAQRGLCMFPKTSLDLRKCEIARFYKLGMKNLYTISMVLPRLRSDAELQEDVYPPTFSSIPSLTPAEFFEGVNRPPNLVSLKPLFQQQQAGQGAQHDIHVDPVASSPCSSPTQSSNNRQQSDDLSKHEVRTSPVESATKTVAQSNSSSVPASASSPVERVDENTTAHTIVSDTKAEKKKVEVDFSYEEDKKKKYVSDAILRQEAIIDKIKEQLSEAQKFLSVLKAL